METEKLIKELGDKFTQLEAQNKRLKEENRLLKSEHFKDEELARMKTTMDQLQSDLIRGFPISEKEESKIKQWLNSHDCIYKGTRLGGVSEYRFGIIPGIGYNGYAKCTCGKEFCFYEE